MKKNSFNSHCSCDALGYIGSRFCCNCDNRSVYFRWRRNSSVVTDRSGISGTFTVSYPAETTIYWGTESTEIGYTVSSTLVSGNNLRVTVAQDNANLHTGGGRLLPYTITGDTNITTGHETVTNSAYSVNVNITKENWGSVSIDEYEDTLTFTASVEAIA